MTREYLENNMSNQEFHQWISYFEIRPVGWRDDLRTFYLLQSFSGLKGKKPYDIFPSLLPIFKRTNSNSDRRGSLRGSAFLMQMINAKDGDKLTILGDL